MPEKQRKTKPVDFPVLYAGAFLAMVH